MNLHPDDGAGFEEPPQLKGFQDGGGGGGGLLLNRLNRPIVTRRSGNELQYK